MKKPAPVNSLLQRLLEVKRSEIETPPDNFKTTYQWAKEWGVSTAQASRRLREALRFKLVEVKPYRVACGSRVLSVPHYAEVA